MRFLNEPLLGGVVSSQVRREEPDGDRALETWVAGLMDDAHAPCAELTDNLVGAKRRTGELAHATANSVGCPGLPAGFVSDSTAPVANTARGSCSHLYEFGEAEGQLLTLLVFLAFGSVMVPAAIPAWNLSAVASAVLSLTLVRMLPVALSLVDTGLMPSTVAFVGWFGPRGLASILFALLIVDGDRLATGAQLESVVVLTVFLSTMLHGLTASYPLTIRYASSLENVRQEAMPERRDSPEMPVRIRHLGSH